MLDAKSESAIAEAIGQLRERLGTRLVSAVLYGSAAGPDFVLGTSDVNLMIVLDVIEPIDLQTIRPLASRWRKRRFATPLVVDRAFLRNAADVFPMELLDIKRQHRVVFGEDIIATVHVADEHLRRECEREARGKLLRLRELYLEVGDSRGRIRALMLDSVKTFLIIMRNVNRLRGVAGTESLESVLRAFAEHFQCELPVMARLLHIKRGAEKWPANDEATFREYVAEVQRLVAVVDRLASETTTTDASI